MEVQSLLSMDCPQVTLGGHAGEVADSEVPEADSIITSS